jgi:beta-1,4-mannosyltransferase
MAQTAVDSHPARARDTQQGAKAIVSLPRALATNPYQRLLYDELGRHGFELVEGSFKAGWLARNRRRASILHFHWPEAYYRHRGGPRALRPLLAWAKVALFGLRLSVARLLGYRVVWTVHQVRPHEPSGAGIDRAATKRLARSASLLLAHDEATAALAAQVLGGRAIRVVPHGSYLGAYPEGAGRAEMRSRLGLGQETVAFLSFGNLRGYKHVDRLLDSFAAADLPDAALVIAGPVADDDARAAVEGAAALDPRVKPLLGYVPDEGVAELFGACDVAVVARSDGGTSGSLVLALSLGLPVVASERYAELVDACGWTFTASLRPALEAAARAEDHGERSQRALERARSLSWDEIGASVASSLEEVLAR